MKKVNFMLIILTFIICYLNVPSLFAKGLYPTINFWSLMMIKVLIMSIMFKFLYKKISSDNILDTIFSVNLSSSFIGFTVSSIMYHMVPYGHIDIRPLHGWYIVALISFIIVNIFDSIVMVSANIVDTYPAKTCIIVFCSNIISFLIILTLITYNIDMLNQKRASENETKLIEYLKQFDEYK